MFRQFVVVVSGKIAFRERKAVTVSCAVDALCMKEGLKDNDGLNSINRLYPFDGMMFTKIILAFVQTDRLDIF